MTSVNLTEWEWASQENPLELPAHKAWRTAVAAVAASAKRALPEANRRIDNAVKLILSGGVELLPNGTARVASQSDPKTFYVVKGRGCTCPDALYGAKDGWCKHLLATLILKRTTAMVKRQMEANRDRPASVRERASASAEKVPKFQEASASYTLKLPLSGLDVVVTLCDTSEQALFPRVRLLLAWAQGQAACKTEDRPRDDKHGLVLQKHQQND
jgi:hypothetical protein